MSWTIEKGNKESKELSGLNAAVGKAKQENILMLCAASDQGNSTALYCFPAACGTCIRVGASTGTGEKCAWVHQKDYDILLPGENVPLDLGIGTLPTEHSGSSVATAIAAGFAGLIIYLDWFINPQDHKKPKRCSRFADKLEMQSMFAFLASLGVKEFPRAAKLNDLAGKNWKIPKDQKAVKEGLQSFFRGFQVRSVEEAGHMLVSIGGI